MARTDKDTPEGKESRWSMGVNHWPVPSWYRRGLNREERALERQELDRARRDHEYAPVPRKHRNDASWYW